MIAHPTREECPVSRLLFATIALMSATLPAMPASAQEAGGERVNQLIVYGDDPCPAPAAEGEITVCARKAEQERYRIPEALRETHSPANDAWNNKVIAYETIGARGTLSCSPVGAGGSLGCTKKLIDEAYAEKRGASDIRFSQLIADERAKRLSTIDADAAETQKRVEDIEKQYDERKRREQEAAAQGQPQPPAGELPAVP